MKQQLLKYRVRSKVLADVLKTSSALLLGNRMVSSRRAAGLGTAAAALLVLASASRPVFDEVQLTCVLWQDV